MGYYVKNLTTTLVFYFSLKGTILDQKRERDNLDYLLSEDFAQQKNIRVNSICAIFKITTTTMPQSSIQ